MTPRRLDAALVQGKLRLLDELLDDLESLGALDAARLRGDRMLRHAVERILTQVVQLAVDVNSHMAGGLHRQSPTDYRTSFRMVAEAGVLPSELAESLLPSVGLRNLLVHEYATIDLERVAAACGQALAGYRAYVREVSRFLGGLAAG